MAKSLLSLALIVTQLLSWSASPLYLCLGSDGSVCVDHGPDGCECCKHSHSDDECVGSRACKDHDHNNPGERGGHQEDLAAGDPCDCTHIQILQTQSPTLIPSSNSPDVEHLIVILATIPCDLCAHVGVPPISETAKMLHMLDAPPLSLILLASVNMRC